MKENNVIREIIEKLRLKKKYENTDFDKLKQIFEDAELKAPQFDSIFELHKLKRRIYSEKQSKISGLKRIPLKKVLIPALAASILLFSATYLFVNKALYEENDRINCAFSNGDIRLIRGGDAIEFKSGNSLTTDDTVETSKRSFADLIYRGTVRIRLKENSKLSISNLMISKEGKMIFDVTLSKGKLLVDFLKLSHGDEAYVRTPTSIAVVRGTSFGVYIDKNQNVRYEVNSGKIKIKHRIMIDDDLVNRITSKELLEQLNDSIEENSVILEKNMSCVIDSKDYYKFKYAVDNLLQKASESKINLQSEDISRISDLIVKPSLKTATSLNSIMIPELKEFTNDGFAKEGNKKKVALSIYTFPEDAMISVDGKTIGKGSTTLLTTTGIRHVEIRAGGFHSRKLDVNVNDRDIEISVNLIRASDQNFNFNEWASQIDSSYLLSIAQRDLLLSINREGRIIAVSKKGLIWGCDLDAAVNSLPVSDGNSLFIATDDNRIIALSLKSGKLLWSKRINGSLHLNARLMINRNSLYAGTTKGFLYKFSKNGRLLWRMKFNDGIYATPVQSGRFLFVSTNDDNIYGIDEKLQILIFKVRVGRVLGSTINIKDKRLFISNYDGEVLCYNYDVDEIEWRYNTGSRIIVDSQLQANHLYVSNVNGDISKLDITGNVLWKISVGNRVERAPTLDSHNIYILSDKVLYVVDKENGSIKWSYVIPHKVTTNIALSKKNMYFGTDGKGIIVLRK